MFSDLREIKDKQVDLYIFLRGPQIILDSFRLLFRQYLKVKISLHRNISHQPFLCPDPFPGYLVPFERKANHSAGDQSGRFSAER